MTRDAFWKIIDRCARAEDSEEALRKALVRLTPGEVAAFDKLFYRYVDDAFTWDLWGAAYLAMGGCSEDGFEYSRRGILTRGSKFYERVVANPDALAGVEDAEELENEEIGCVAAEVYEEKTGKALPRLRRRVRPTGRRWDFEDERACAKRFPKIFASVRKRLSSDDASASSVQETEGELDASAERSAANRRQTFDGMVTVAWTMEAADIDEAILHYEAALAFIGDDDSSPMFPLAHRNLAHHYVKRGDAARARPLMETALRTRARLAGMPAYLARLEAGVAWFFVEHAPSRLDEALSLARAAQRRAGVERDVLLAAIDSEVVILEKLGRTADARKALRRGLRIAPHHPDLQAAKSRLGL